ncbi:MAG: hypothetical protein HQ483_07805 [Rhodospirillales bacterium]|nr:hypothetical protein [Rhodospirillales bacterium]
MSLDITPVTAPGRQVIQRYGGGGFRIAGISFLSSVLVMAESSVAWPVTRPADITLESLQPLFADEFPVGIVLIGCGAKFTAPPKDLRAGLKAQGAVLEWMDTGAACRTLNVLLNEERQVMAALIAVD